MKHLTRPGVILLIVLGGVFFALRMVPVTEPLESFGFYQGKDNSHEWASLPAQYADPQLCNQCHADKSSLWQKSPHKSVSCENCHGPGGAHTQGKGLVVVDTSREVCAVCHTKLSARPRDFPQVEAQHEGNSSCVTCHNPHSPVINSAPRITHSPEGRTDCLLCHNAGGIKPFPTNHQAGSQEACLSCHVTK